MFMAISVDYHYPFHYYTPLHTRHDTAGALNIYVKPHDESVNFLPPTLQLSGSSDARWYTRHINITSVNTDFQVG